MIILAIETSCDDTCVAIVKAKSQKSKVKSFEILSNIVSSQVRIHAKYGGVYPFLAKREHQKNLPIVFKKALKEAKISEKDIDVIAVTIGPGLEPCLWVGINFAKQLAKKIKKPLIPVNHIEAHIFSNFIDKNSKFKIQNSKLFPAVCLVVSGGHTQLILMEDIGKYKILGETRDDAAGECFDKTARILGLNYPGGPAIAAEAERYKFKTQSSKLKTQNLKFKIHLPRPMIYQKNYDFSFSGLKTAVLYNFKSQPEKIRKSKNYIQEMATEVQQAIIDVLIHKTLRAAKEYKAKTIILGGGVAANEELRKQFQENLKKDFPKIKIFLPSPIFCTDNAAMVAIAAYFKIVKNKFKMKGAELEKVQAKANLRLSENLI